LPPETFIRAESWHLMKIDVVKREGFNCPVTVMANFNIDLARRPRKVIKHLRRNYACKSFSGAVGDSNPTNVTT
jgi:hypothetical protein